MKKEVMIEGMSCQNCVNHVTKAIEEIPGVKAVKVHLKKKNASVKFDDALVSLEIIRNKINEETVYHASIKE